MSDLIVNGGRRLSGKIVPSANKNAVLPILCATLLCDEPITIHRTPNITDVIKILDFFRSIGSDVDYDLESQVLKLHHHDAIKLGTQKLPAAMRSSVMLIPPLLRRFGEARVESEVKGCSLGSREIDPHIEIMELFGATVTTEDDALLFRLEGPPTPVTHWLDYASVTTTENFVLLASLADGESRLTNAASEPHVQEFCDFMEKLGASIQGSGTSRVTVSGVSKLKGVEFTLTDDFHEVATFLALSAITGGDIRVRNRNVEQFPLINRTFGKFGVTIEQDGEWSLARVGNALEVREPYTSYILTKVEAAPWPYIPVDLLPIFVALGIKAKGSVMYWNKVYEGAFGWTTELSKFGAHVHLSDPHRLVVFGGKRLVPATVESPYIIRVALALLMISLSIEGRSKIMNATPIKRAHPNFVENLNSIGADVTWEPSL